VPHLLRAKSLCVLVVSVLHELWLLVTAVRAS